MHLAEVCSPLTASSLYMSALVNCLTLGVFTVQDPSVQQATRLSGKTQGLSDFNPFASEQQQFVGQNYGSQVLFVNLDLCDLS